MDHHEPATHTPPEAIPGPVTTPIHGANDEQVLDAVQVRTFTATPAELYTNQPATLSWDIQRPPGRGTTIRFSLRDDQTGQLIGLTTDQGTRPLRPRGIGRSQYSLWGQLGQ